MSSARILGYHALTAVEKGTLTLGIFVAKTSKKAGLEDLISQCVRRPSTVTRLAEQSAAQMILNRVETLEAKESRIMRQLYNSVELLSHRVPLN